MSAPRIAPSWTEFSRRCRRHDLIPVVAEMLGDLDTPVSAFQKMHGGLPGFLLESVEGGETWGRYSILGVSPAGRFTARGREVTLTWRGRRTTRRADDPLAELRRWLSRFHPAVRSDLPRFVGGAVGYVAYDAIRYFESIPDRHRAVHAPPEIDLLLVSDVVVFDNLSHTVKLVACAFPGRNPRAAYEDACERVHAMARRLQAPIPKVPAPRPRNAVPRLRSETSQRAFENGVRRVQRHIRAGDAFQVVLSHELSCRLHAAPLDVYRALRCINPSPYMFFLDYGDRQLAGASPEVLVRVEEGRASVRPIAGTRRRGRNEAEDHERIEDLRADAKERAEHLMLVDLGRNDLGRVCRYGSVRTDEFMSIEKYSHVIHLVSRVSGELAAGCDCFDALRACFPAGTVSGAPKIRAMEIIDELERRRRGVYAGAVGYFGFGGAMDTCIAIRTILCENRRARIGVGAGIVLDSQPAREWTETLEKAEAARAAVELAERGLDL